MTQRMGGGKGRKNAVKEKESGGWPTLSHFSIDESTLVDNTILVRKR